MEMPSWQSYLRRLQDVECGWSWNGLNDAWLLKQATDFWLLLRKLHWHFISANTTSLDKTNEIFIDKTWHLHYSQLDYWLSSVGDSGVLC